MRQITAPSLLALLVLGTAPAAFAQGKGWVNPKASESSNSTRSVVDAINFETDTATVVNGQVTLACVSDALKADKTLFVTVEGYADGRGGDAYNLRLSTARAKAVVEYLKLMGAPMDRLRFLGKGKAAPTSSDVVTNFARRKALLLVSRGAFDGESVKSLPTEGLPCSTVSNGEVPMGRIENNGQSFVVSVDYAKIRQDFRAEVARMLAERPAPAPVDQPDSGQAQPAQVGQRDLRQVSASEKTDSVREFRMSMVFYKTNLEKTENALGFVEGAGLFRIPGGALQTGIQGEFGKYRRKMQADLAYSAVVGPFQGTVFGSYVSMSGTSSDASSLYGSRSGLLGGARVGFEWPAFGIGFAYATGVSNESTASGNTPAQNSQPTQEPLGLAGADLRLGGEGVYLRVAAYQNLQSQKQVNSGSIKTKSGSIVELGYAFSNGFTLLLRGEALPIYETFSPSADLRETRMGIGFRIGGRSSGSLNWVNVPTARMIHPF